MCFYSCSFHQVPLFPPQVPGGFLPMGRRAPTGAKPELLPSSGRQDCWVPLCPPPRAWPPTEASKHCQAELCVETGRARRRAASSQPPASAARRKLPGGGGGLNRPEALQWGGNGPERRKWDRIRWGVNPSNIYPRKEGPPSPPSELELFPRGGGGMELVMWGRSC